MQKRGLKKIDRHLKQKANYERMQKELEQSIEVQISTSDPDSRQLITRNNITEVAYNIQSSVDVLHHIPIDFKVTNKNDSKAMGHMVRRANTVLGKSDFTALYDKGYHTGSEFDYAHKQGVEVIVAFPDVASHAPDMAFDVEHFHYDKLRDQYTCPAGELLVSNWSWYKRPSGKTIIRVKHYKTKACHSCAVFERCTKNKAGRLIERSEHMDLIDANKRRVTENPELYRKRQAIVEALKTGPCPFSRNGVIKRQWDFYYIMTKKTMQRASADVGLIFTAYNLRRIFNLIDKNVLKKHLKGLALIFSLIIKHFKAIRCIQFFALFSPRIQNRAFKSGLNRLYFRRIWFGFELKGGF